MSEPEQATRVLSLLDGPTLAQPSATPTGEARPAREVPAPGRTVAGRYTVLEPLGQGGMGVVLAAYDARLDRRVALKLLHSQEESEHGHARMVREAQAMARLSHPHVVAVYDAGTLEDGSVFIAMEYVQGRTLRRWCEEQPRTWREVLQAYVDAGRGLAAAHAAGLVHRDFKPENVLVGLDGRVRVTDFGAARAESLPTPAPLPAEPPPLAPGAAWEDSLTMPGMVLGTPRYMAPELFHRQSADVRSDLFAFCVALYEALHGQPAFAGTSRQERMQAQLAGRVNPPPTPSPVPAAVTRAVLRGLETDPARRPASMLALLALLEEDPAVRRQGRWRTLAQASAAGALAALLLTLGGLHLHEQRNACAHQERRLAGVWDRPVREQLRQALVATGVPYAGETAARVAQALDGYAGTWVTLRAQACEAERESPGHAQSLAVLQVRCLERRRSQLRALTELLARSPDAELVPRAIQAVQSLPSLQDCTDAQVLTAAVPPPEDPRVRERTEALQPEVDRLEALYEAGKYQEGLALGERLSGALEALDYPPLRARALVHLAMHREGVGDSRGAEAAARQALLLAARGGDDAMMARAYSMLPFVVGFRQGRAQEVLALELAVQAAVERARDDHAAAHALNGFGLVYHSLGQTEAARERLERSLALWQKLLGPENARAAAVLNNLGFVLLDLQRPQEAQECVERALRMFEKVLGPEHPDVANTLNSLGDVLRARGRDAEALAVYERALALGERVLGPEHLFVAESLHGQGRALLKLGRPEEARARLERALKANTPLEAELRLALAQVLRALGQERARAGR